MVPADEPHQLALNLHLIRCVDAGFVAWVARHQRHRAALALQALEGGFLAAPEAAAQASDALADCGRDSCTPKPGAPLMVAGWWRLKTPSADQLAALCASARLVILRTGEGSCPGVRVIGREESARGGAAEVFRLPNGRWRISWAQDARGDRPWTAPAPEEEGS